MFTTLFDTLVTFFVSLGGSFSWMIIPILALLLTAGLRLLLYAIFESLPGEKLRTLTLALVFIVTSTTLLVAMLQASEKLRAEAEAIEHKAWVAARCPVFKFECGYKAKHKYSCERKGAVVGRNQVGDIFVEAYPTC